MNRSNLSIYLGNSRYIPFRLRRMSIQGYWNVTQFSDIEVEYRRIGDPAPLTPVSCSPLSPGAVWSAGLVPALVSPLDVTARVGTYEYTVTLYASGLELTAGAGRLEVLDRPVPLFAGPGGISWASTNLMSYPALTNIAAGQVVARTAGGMVLANAGPSYLQADGVAVADAIAGGMCLFINNGTLTMPNWTGIFGTTSLPLGGQFYLDVAPGGLTVTVPTLPLSGLRQNVGETVTDPQTLSVTLNYTVIL